ncbi:hypothetical protein Chor_007414 [Crotalus horridus]
MEQCLKCPPKSISHSPAATSCPCIQGFFRTSIEDQTVACTSPPSTPRHLNFSLVGTQISLWWQPPLDRGGRQDLTYSVSCQLCHFLVCEPCQSSVMFSPSALGLLKPSVVVDGLEAYTNYSFTVRAHNGVSGLSLASRNSTSSPIWVSVGHAAPVVVTNIILDKQNDSSLSVTWLPSRHRSQSSVNYEVLYFVKGEEKHYTVHHLQKPQVTLANLQPDTAYLLRVRSITPLGPGPYSQEQEFRTLPQGCLFKSYLRDSEQTRRHRYASWRCDCVNYLWNPVVHWADHWDHNLPSSKVKAAAPKGKRRWVRAHHHRARPCHNGYNRDEMWLKPYVDLQPYEDPRRGVLEFTKELDPSLVSIDTVIGEGNPMMIITEYMENGALDTFLRVMKSIEDGYQLPPPVDCPSILYDLMKVCWSYDRTRRPRFREIQAQLEHFLSSPHLLRTVADFDPRVTLRLPSCSGSDGIPYRTIPEWLESIRMKRYILNFHTAGLNTMESVLDLSAEDLKQMGVVLPGHQKRILCSIQGFKE